MKSRSAVYRLCGVTLEPGLRPIERSIAISLNFNRVARLSRHFCENVVEQMAGLIQELKIENVQDKKPVLDKRLPTKVSYIIKFHWLHIDIILHI